MIIQILRDDKYQEYEKLKLVILYALKYEQDDKIMQMINILRELKI